MSNAAGLLLSATMPDYSEVLDQINSRVLGISDLLRGMSDSVELAVGILAGVVCFLGVVFGFLFIKFLFDQIRR